MTSNANKKLNKQRRDIVSTGKKDFAYMGNHNYAPKHRKQGCGVAVLIVGLAFVSSAIAATTYLLS